jgi:hypothetical protein
VWAVDVFKHIRHFTAVVPVSNVELTSSSSSENHFNVVDSVNNFLFGS